jgi:hypothetical protein
MELASLVADEAWSDHPACVHPVLAAVARGVNDAVTDACHPRLAALLPQMIGTATRRTPDDQRVYRDRSARMTLRCAAVALGQTAVLGSEMESARRTALAVLARQHSRASASSRADEPSPATGSSQVSRADRAGESRSGLAARLCVALLDRAGLLDRIYPAMAARQVAQAVAG